jgi:hypothetical protein
MPLLPVRGRRILVRKPQWDQEEGEYTWPQLGHLYELARGHALKIDSVLDGLLEDLQGDQ